jgi:hypothetical protein
MRNLEKKTMSKIVSKIISKIISKIKIKNMEEIAKKVEKIWAEI